MKLFWAVLFAGCTLGGTARAQEMFGWAYNGPLNFTEQESKTVVSSSPLFSKRLGRVKFYSGNICLDCGDFSDAQNLGVNHIRKRLEVDYQNFLRDKLLQSKIFPPDIADRISIAVKLTSLTQSSSVGAAAERKNMLTSGATLSTTLSMQYEMFDGEQVVGAWTVTTHSDSNSLNPSTRLAENIDAALKRNIRGFLLNIIEKHSPTDSLRAKQELAILNAQVDNTRTVFGYLVYGSTKVAATSAGIVGDTLIVLAQNSDQIASRVQTTRAEMEALGRGSSIADDRAKAARDAAFYEAAQELAADPNSQQNVDKRTRERESEQGRRAETDRVAKRDAATRASNEARDTARKADTREYEDARKKDADSFAATQERERKAVEQRNREERERLAAQREADAQTARLAKAKADQLAKEQSDKRAHDDELRRELQERDRVLVAMKNGIRLVATKCPDGEGHYYVTGTKPSVKGAACVDVNYEAVCPGSKAVVTGIAKNFVGLNGCFGDTYQIAPKPACAVGDVSVRVTSVQPGCK
jgi:hypothetical protein